MPRYSVQRDDGKWACFSTAVCEYVSEWMPERDYLKWREIEYGVKNEPILPKDRLAYEEAERYRAFNDVAGYNA